MGLHGKNIIAGELCAKGEAGTQATNPATGETLPGAFVPATGDELDRATAAAEEAAGQLNGKSKTERGALLRRMAAEIVALGDELTLRCSAETGLPLGRLESERTRTTNQLGMFAGLVEEGSWVDARIDTALPERSPQPRPDLRRMLIPIGPVAVFCASNFPLAFSVAGGDTASAIAAGCPVVVKAHSSHPGTAELVGTALTRAISETGMPAGLFSLLHGPGRSIGTALVTDPKIRAAGFTGSQAGGRALYDAAASRPEPIPVYAEMGSINPVFLLPGALETRAAGIASGLTGSVTLGVGQFCTNPGLVVGLKSKELDGFIKIAADLFKDAPCGTMLNRKIRSAYEDGLAALQNLSVVQTAGISSSTPRTEANECSPALLVVDARDFMQKPSLEEEVFGPSTLIVRAETADEMVALARKLKGHLTATIHGTDGDIREHQELVTVLREKVGRLIFNGFPTGVEVSPGMNHGGPYPASTDVHYTSVGTAAIYRFARPICFQGFPDSALPPELQRANPLKIWRTVDGNLTGEPG